MTRTDLLAYLVQRYTVLATAAGQTAFDGSPLGFGPAIDDAFRLFGTAESDLPTAQTTSPTDDTAIRALADYAMLNLCLVRLAAAVDVTRDTPAVAQKRSQAFTQTQALFKRAETLIAQLGYSPVSDFALGRIQLDFLEPANEGLGGGLSPWGY